MCTKSMPPKAFSWAITHCAAKCFRNANASRHLLTARDYTGSKICNDFAILLTQFREVLLNARRIMAGWHGV